MFNPENHLFIIYWQCYRSLNSKIDLFSTEGGNPCSVAVLGHVKSNEIIK
jgi:hypothetical protein